MRAKSTVKERGCLKGPGCSSTRYRGLCGLHLEPSSLNHGRRCLLLDLPRQLCRLSNTDSNPSWQPSSLVLERNLPHYRLTSSLFFSPACISFCVFSSSSSVAISSSHRVHPISVAVVPTTFYPSFAFKWYARETTRRPLCFRSRLGCAVLRAGFPGLQRHSFPRLRSGRCCGQSVLQHRFEGATAWSDFPPV